MFSGVTFRHDKNSNFFNKTTKPTKAVKRKARVHDSDSEDNEDDAADKISFSQRIAKHAAPKGRSHIYLIDSYPHFSLEKAPAKKRRMSKGSREDDDFIVSDGEEEEEIEESRSRASSENEDASASDEERPKKKGKKASLHRWVCVNLCNNCVQPIRHLRVRPQSLRLVQRRVDLQLTSC